MTEEKLRKDILIVDDTPANLRLLTDMLKERGYFIRVSPNGSMALQAVEKSPPSLILLDINMPGMNGYDVCSSLKDDRRYSHIPVIFISALNEVFDKVKAFQVGGVDYITKPFQFEEVHARLKTHLKIDQLQKELERTNFNLRELVQEQVREIAEAQYATIMAMVRISEDRDDDTGRHIDRTSSYCRILAEKLMENQEFRPLIDAGFIENITNASPLHDIGKVGIPDSILLKPGKLDNREFEIMKTHTVIGAKTLQAVHEKHPGNSFVEMGLRIARSHHEKWNGSGYPDGLSGEDIPLPARIMTVSDTYDALRSERVYKQGFSHEKSMEILRNGRGRDFDPRLIDALLDLEEVFQRVKVELDA